MTKKRSGRRPSILSRLRRKSPPREHVSGTVITRAEQQRKRSELLSTLDGLIARYDQMIESANRSTREFEARLGIRRKP